MGTHGNMYEDNTKLVLVSLSFSHSFYPYPFVASLGDMALTRPELETLATIIFGYAVVMHYGFFLLDTPSMRLSKKFLYRSFRF